jgi:hypothetical protein
VCVLGRRAVTFRSCHFRHLSGVYAIAAQGGTQHLSVLNCSFQDVGGGGVKFGRVANCSTGCANSSPSSDHHASSGAGNQWWPRPDTPIEEQDRGLLVTNSRFEGPTEFHGANAIFVGYHLRDTIIRTRTLD